MGSYKSKMIKIQITERPEQRPQPDYVVKTRSPRPIFSWHKNILRGKREDDLRDEAMPIVRRKCYDPIMEYKLCCQEQGTFWAVFNCQEVYSHVSACLVREFDVEMDKRRRDLKRNPQSWWKEFYNEEGEIGYQAEWAK